MREMLCTSPLTDFLKGERAEGVTMNWVGVGCGTFPAFKQSLPVVFFGNTATEKGLGVTSEGFNAWIMQFRCVF
jgi:hypothetical protein